MAEAPQQLPGVREPKQEESSSMRILSNVLAAIGLILIAVVVIWGVAHLFNLSGFSFSSLFATSPKLELTAPKSAVSGQPLTISWKNTSSAPGTYALLYQCEKNFSFATQSGSGVLNTVPCGISFNTGSSTSATMTPLVIGSATVSVPVSVVFVPSSSGSRESASMTIEITPSASPISQAPTSSAAAQTAPAKKPTTSSSYRTSGNYSPVAHAAYGPADLSVRIIATGYIDPGSGALLMNRQPQPGDTVGVEFDIMNVGGSATGSYYFQAYLPTVSGYTYTSPLQASLAPGAHVVSTLRFTQLAPQGGIFTVIADPSGSVSDANQTNNEAATNIY